MATSNDWKVRLAAFDFLDAMTQQYGEVLPFRVLSREFYFQGVRVPLLGPTGIFKPKVLDRIPLTIATAPPLEGKDAPYEDKLGEDGLIYYRYRGTDPMHRDNVGLRLAMTHRVPLIYLFGVVRGQYVASWPVFVVHDDPVQLTVTIQVDQSSVLRLPPDAVFDDSAAARREYITVATKRRLHQAAFRERVLRAYRRCCAICRLKHEELLDAAHILPDSHPQGAPVVQNGLALCKLHHTAFDRNLLGVRPDLRIEVARAVLREKDGPMLVHGLQGFHERKLHVPTSAALRPGSDYLEVRYKIFRSAC